MEDAQSQLDAWMQQALGGDDEAFGRVADNVQDLLYRLGLAHGLGASDAAEAVQETLLRAYSGRRKWRPDSDVAAWMSGIMMNVVRELRRKRRRRETITLEAALAWGSDGPGADGKGSDPDAAARMECLEQAVAALPPRQREAVTCRFLMGMNVRQTADAMACAEGTVKAAVSAALENLRRLMEDQR